MHTHKYRVEVICLCLNVDLSFFPPCLKRVICSQRMSWETKKLWLYPLNIKEIHLETELLYFFLKSIVHSASLSLSLSLSQTNKHAHKPVWCIGDGCLQNSRCVDGTGRTLLTQAWLNTETFIANQVHIRITEWCMSGKILKAQMPMQSLPHWGVLLSLSRVKPSRFWWPWRYCAFPPTGTKPGYGVYLSIEPPLDTLTGEMVIPSMF